MQNVLMAMALAGLGGNAYPRFGETREQRRLRNKDRRMFNVGATYGGTGTNGVQGQRLSKSGALSISQAAPKYQEQSSLGVMFSACHNAGDAPGTTISTSAHTCLYNPPGSTVRVILARVYLGYVSGTIGTGTMFHCANPTINQTAPSGTAPTGGVVNLSIGNTAAAQAVPSWTSTVVAPKVLTPLTTLSPDLASTVLALTIWADEIDGWITLLPGTSYQIQSIAAGGSTPLISSGLVWIEEPLFN
jgi:hypothetical protein